MRNNSEYAMTGLAFLVLSGLSVTVSAATPTASGGSIWFEGAQNDSVLTVSCNTGEYAQQRFDAASIPSFAIAGDGYNVANAYCKYSLRVLTTDGSAPDVLAGYFLVENGAIELPSASDVSPMSRSTAVPR